MKILLLIFHGLSDCSGVSKKILAQSDAFKQEGHQVFLCTYQKDERGHRVRTINGNTIQDFGSGPMAPILKRISYGAIKKFVKEKGIEMVYIRSFHNANPWTIALCHSLHKSGARIVLEIPTYPYDHEYKQAPLWWKTELSVDKLFRRMLARKVDRIATFSEHDSIFGCKTICISNAVDFDKIPIRSTLPPASGQATNLLCVAEVHTWHGIDRIIAGLGIWKQQEKEKTIPTLHIVGRIDEPEEKFFKSLIKRYKLEKHIIFHGPLYGEDLDDMFNSAHIAIGSLGRHRSGIYNIKTLKNREYAARGIPFIYSESDSDFDNMPYILKVPSDETPIDFDKLLAWSENVKTFSPMDIRKSINHLSWRKQMQIVIEEITNIEKEK